MKQKMKSNKGITLIALVITIIVLLILAAVTIATLTGENGILTKATKAKTDTQIAEEDEKVKLAIASAYDSNGKLDQNLLITELKNQGLNAKQEGENVVVTTSHKIYTIPSNGIMTELENEEDYSTLKVGDYVNYPVYYDNVESYHNININENDLPQDEYNGWRIASINSSTKTVKLVSAGIPLNYYYNNDTTKSISDLTTNFFTTPINTNPETTTPETFYQCGFKKNMNGETITNIDDLKSIFTTGEPSKITNISNGIPSVQSLTLEDLKDMWGSDISYELDVTSKDLLTFPCKNYPERFARCWIAYSSSENLLWNLNVHGVIATDPASIRGIRPVVTLKANVKFTPAEKKTDGTQIYNVSI